MIALTGLAGWVLAGRAIRPLNSVARAAQEITGVEPVDPDSRPRGRRRAR